MNAPLAVTISSVMIAFFMIADEELPHNDGIMRCIEVVAPEGSLVNPRYPAPTGFGNHLSDQIAAVIMLALAPAVPRQVTACWNHLLATIVAGWSTRAGRAVRRHPDQRLQGRRRRHLRRRRLRPHRPDHLRRRDRRAGPRDLRGRQPALPAPLRVPRRTRRAPGRWRGGLGVETVFTFEDGGVQASVFGDGGTPETAAFGILGGGRGCPNEVEFRYPDGTTYRPHLKDLVSGIPAGTVYRQVAGGGGGYGDPRERPVERVLEEARNGVISLESARTDYGVELDVDTWTATSTDRSGTA